MAKEMVTAESGAMTDDELETDGIEQDQYLVFTAMTQEFGIQAMRVQEISAMVDITSVPKAPSYIEGILNLRGRLVSVINFRKKFGFETKDQDEDTRLIIVEHGGFPIGIMVDSVEEVVRIPNEKVQKVPEATITTESDQYITGVGILDTRLVILLDADKFLSKGELLEAEAIKKALGVPASTLAAPETAQHKNPDAG
jgi:purine-binding chemotaxis protein CheW